MILDAHNDSEFVRHTSCPTCGSSDANAEYTDGHHYCHACSTYTPSDAEAAGEMPAARKKRVAGLIDNGEVTALISRKISQETCAHFGYMKGKHKGQTVQIAPYYNADGQIVAQKIRKPNKDFAWFGDPDTALPFGAHSFPKSGRMLVVTEGEIDAMAMSQAQGNKWPVVSISCGADSPVSPEGKALPMNKIRKYIAKHRDYFVSFDKVVLMFDNDVPGRASAKVAAEVIGPKAHIAELPLKDAGEMLVAGRTEDLIQAMWRAQKYQPAGIVTLDDIEDDVMSAVIRGIPWPWQSLTDMTYGRRTGEIYTFGAGTGIGKTDVFTQIMEQTVREFDLPIGVFSLEQLPKETARRIAGKRAKKRFHVPDAGWTQDELRSTWDDLKKSGKIFLYDSFGQNDWDVIESRIRYLAGSEGVKHFFIDHLTALAAWQEDERVALEQIMAQMGGLVKELDICVYLISHLSTPEGTPHEEGGRVMIRHFKGSRAIGFWSHFMFGLERDQQSDDPAERHITTFRCLKDRYTGQATGKTFLMGYEQDTGMLVETNAMPAFQDETTSDDEQESDF